jgi:hypothetical protein
MMIYFQFYHAKGWHPRQVDDLFEDEEYWLPVMESAANDASAAWMDIQGT